MPKAFPWTQFFAENGIQYRDHGKNVAKNNVAICCPYCDHDDNFTMGVSLTGEGYGCWWGHSQGHSGKSPIKLIQALLGCSTSRAVELAQSYVKTSLTDYGSSIDSLRDVENEDDYVQEGSDRLYFPAGTKKIGISKRSHQKAVEYLRSRGFRKADITDLIKMYDLRIQKDGYWSKRVIIPLYENRKLVSWTSRTYIDSDLRWLSLSNEHEMGDKGRERIGLVNVKDTLLSYDSLMKGGDILVVCEGQFDAIKLGFYGKPFNIKTTCMFSKEISEIQSELLSTIILNFRKVIFILDEGTGMSDVLLSLRFPSAKRMSTPYGREDLGELTWREAIKFSKELSEIK